MKPGVALFSFGTGGTLGHTSLISYLAAGLYNHYDVHVLSEYDCRPYMRDSKGATSWMRIPYQHHTNSNAGAIQHVGTEAGLEFCIKNNIQHAIFSTFFDPTLIAKLDKYGIPSYLITYPLRDSHQELFFLRKFDALFKKVIILGDLYNYNGNSAKVTTVQPVIRPLANQSKKIKNSILVTCGGGGRPSSQKFFEVIDRLYQHIGSIDKDAKVTVVSGPNGPKMEFPGWQCIESTTDLISKIDQSRTVISEAGYFTTHELISRLTPGILIPGQRRIDNQELRAVRYARKVLGYSVAPEESFETLANFLRCLLFNDKEYCTMQKKNSNYLAAVQKRPTAIDLLKVLMQQ